VKRPDVVATRRAGFEHELELAGHSMTVDEPPDAGGEDAGPAPGKLLAGSLAGCTAITMEMYADRKGWDIDGIAVGVETEGTLYGGDLSYEVVVSLPEGLDEDQQDRLLRVAAKCPVHKALAPNIPISVRTGTIS
jgi:putative redox protein